MPVILSSVYLFYLCLTEEDEGFGRSAGVRRREVDVGEHLGGILDSPKLLPVLVDELPPLLLVDLAILIQVRTFHCL